MYYVRNRAVDKEDNTGTKMLILIHQSQREIPESLQLLNVQARHWGILHLIKYPKNFKFWFLSCLFLKIQQLPYHIHANV